jgi:outer membrane protein
MKKTMSRLLAAGLFLLGGSANAQRALSVEQLFELVESGSKQMQVSRTQEKAALQGVAAAKSQRLPDIQTRISASYIGNALITDRHFEDAHGLSSPHFGNNFALDAMQTIYAGGAINAGIDKAKLASEAAKTSTKATRQQERFLALGQYLQLERTDLRLKVVDENIDLTRTLIENIKEKMKQGVALKNDVTRYELQMQTLKLDRQQLLDERSIVNHQLCNLLSLTDSEQINPSADVTKIKFPRQPEQLWQQEALVTSPSLQLSRLAAQQAKQDVRLARSEMLPKVSIVASDQLDGPITYELPPVDKNINVWYVGIGVNYSLSSLFKSNKKVKQARLVAQQRQEETAVAEQQLNNEMQQACTLYEQAYVQWETQKKKVELANENFDVMRERYLNQLALVTDMVDASVNKLDAELEEINTNINIAYAYYKIMYLIGKL